ncbi:DUF6221 family protein [Glycomyces sp. TRM65418]|uniref:DUF6221 family protein n=1 Tax=Glycomyces sp. TRM65418 TaxID=2867006 RepID=UPI001CE5CC2E|nr:DUF6221 family protein [Glycomyces sp. TRM65418]MCC3761742.1 DUF6221 family protein [Glycomyces sp. TRM65418]QZD55827.1 hypothetical protein K3N28_01460 [Glycomyces sp. TRM65418]
MNDLRNFIYVRLVEDEATARAAGAAPWHRGRGGRIEDGAGRLVLVADDDTTAPGPADHIVFHSPARALREVAAGRRILARHRPADRPENGVWACCGCGEWLNFDGDLESEVADIARCRELRDLAAPWADHRDYRPEWAPDEARPVPDR